MANVLFLENVDIPVMDSFLKLLSLLEFCALMLPCQKTFTPVVQPAMPGAR